MQQQNRSVLKTEFHLRRVQEIYPGKYISICVFIQCLKTQKSLEFCKSEHLVVL